MAQERMLSQAHFYSLEGQDASRSFEYLTAGAFNCSKAIVVGGWSPAAPGSSRSTVSAISAKVLSRSEPK
jgi:hypothetical protein